MEERIQRAQLLIMDNRYLDALEILTEILREEPDEREALRLAGTAWMESGEAGKAVKALDYYRKRWGDDARALEALGCSHFKLGNYGLSREILEEAERLDDRNPSIERNLGVVYHHLGEEGKSIRRLEQSNELGPDDYRTMYALAMAYMLAGRPAEAEPLLEGVLKVPTPEEFRTLARVNLKRIHKQIETRERPKTKD
jgi:Flp pilus assembly protein TadD